MTADDHVAIGSTGISEEMQNSPNKMSYEFMTPEQIATILDNDLGFISTYVSRNMTSAVELGVSQFITNIKFLNSVGALPEDIAHWEHRLGDVLQGKNAA